MNSKFTLTILLLFSFSLLFGQPANDDLCNATPITIGEDCMGTANILPELATAQTNEPIATCVSAPNDTLVQNSVWFSFVAPADEIYILAAPEEATISNSYVMSLYTLAGDCADLNNLELQDCNTPMQNLFVAPFIKTTLTEGTTYYLRVSGRSSAFNPEPFASPGCLSIMEVSTLLPTNDDVCNAIDLEVNANAQMYSNIGATSQLDEFPLSPPPSLSSPLAVFNDGWAPGTNFLDNSVWFTFTTGSDGGNYSIDLSGTTTLPGGFNTQVAVYSASDCGDLTGFSLLEAGDNSLPPGSPVNANATLDLFCLPANTTYYVVVDGGASFLFMPVPSQGYFSIQVTAPDPIPLAVDKFIHGPDCVGDTGGTVYALGSGGAGEYSYAWSTGDSISSLINTLAAGTYTLTLTDRCEESFVDTIVMPESWTEPLAAISGDDQSACLGEEVQLSAAASGGIWIDTKRVYNQKVAGFGTYSLINTELQRPELQDTISSSQDIQLSEMEFIGDDLYGTTFDERLYQINVSTGEITLIDTILVESVIDLSYVPSADKLYCTTSAGEIFELDPTTAGLTAVSTITGMAGISQAAIDDNEVMYVGAFAGELYTVDINTGAATLVGGFPMAAGIALRAMEIDHSDGRLYATASTTIQAGSGATWQQTSEVDKTTGERLNRYVDFTAMGPTLAMAIKPRTVAPYQYDWTPAADLSDPGSANPNFTVNQTTTLTAMVSDACASASTTTDVNLLPDASTIIDTTIVEGGMYDGTVYNEDAVLMETLMAANGCDSSVTVNITVMTTSTNEQWAADAIQISPNPVHSNLIVITEGLVEAGTTIYLRDLNGRILLQQRLKEQKFDLDVSFLQKGYYVLELRSAKKYGVERFMKM